MVALATMNGTPVSSDMYSFMKLQVKLTATKIQKLVFDFQCGLHCLTGLTIAGVTCIIVQFLYKNNHNITSYCPEIITNIVKFSIINHYLIKMITPYNDLI